MWDMEGALELPVQERAGSLAEVVAPDRPWVTMVWDDPINLMSYVTFVFQDIFGHSKEKAQRLMLNVHQLGKAVVSSGTREEMERDVAQLHAAGLWATLQHDA